MEIGEEFLCKRDVWLNIQKNELDILNFEELSKKLSFDKLSPESILVYKKYKIYKRKGISNVGISIGSEIYYLNRYNKSATYNFVFNFYENDFLYFYSVFMKSGFIRKVKIMRLFNS